MKVIEDFNEDGVSLLDLNCGDLFTHDGGYYMKCDDARCLMNWTENNKEDCPIVDMATGKIEWLNRNTIVPPIYARIRINGRAD